jgi:hypothetical protein
MALFRLFVIVQLELIRGRGRTPWLLLIVGSAYFAVYAFFDATAALDRAQLLYDCETEIGTVLPSETCATFFHIAHCIIMLVWMLLAAAQGRKYAPMRAVVFSIAAFTDIVATAFAQIICVHGKLFAFTVVPDMVNDCCHITTGAFAIFFMHPNGISTHELLTGKVGLEDGLIVDEMTSGDEPDQGFAKEDDAV